VSFGQVEVVGISQPTAQRNHFSDEKPLTALVLERVAIKAINFQCRSAGDTFASRWL